MPDMSVFELLDYTNVFHNLKAAVKEVCTGAAVDHIYYKNTKPSPEEIRRAVRNTRSSVPCRNTWLGWRGRPSRLSFTRRTGSSVM